MIDSLTIDTPANDPVGKAYSMETPSFLPRPRTPSTPLNTLSDQAVVHSDSNPEKPRGPAGELIPPLASAAQPRAAGQNLPRTLLHWMRDHRFLRQALIVAEILRRPLSR